MQYKHLFFDLDHTLWDFQENSREVLKIIYQEYNLEEQGINNCKDFQNQFEQNNLKFWNRFRRGYITREELRWKRFWHALLFFNIRNKEMAVAMSQTFFDLLPYQKRLIPFASDLLKYVLAKDYRMHIITNGFAETQRKKLQYAGIDNYFEVMATSQTCGCMKPESAIFSYALKQAGASKEESLMIGDSIEADVLGAQKFGIDQAYFNPKKTMHAEKPTYEVNSLKELTYIL